MKLSIILVFCLVFAIGGTGAVYQKDSDPSVKDLAWMAGCWRQNGKNADTFISETWTSPFGTIIGTNRTIRDGKVRAYEYLRIESREDGIYYVARPSGAAAETGFKLLSLQKNKVVFENKQHDFPKRVIYFLEESGKLGARVEDDSNGIDFTFSKVGCDE